MTQLAAAPIVALGEVDSTNAEGMRRAAAGVRGPLWITARCQTAGRGRAGRLWGTPDGNLAQTLLFAPGCEPSALAGLSLVAGIATFDAVASCLAGSVAGDGGSDRVPTGAGALRLKWPNDVLLDGAKLSGCLIESTVQGGAAIVAIGIGINVAVAPDVTGREVASLAGRGASVGADSVGASLRARLAHWIGIWDGGAGMPAIRRGWLARSFPVGTPMSVGTGDGRLEGTFAGLAEDGALLLGVAGSGVRCVSFGDVSVG